MPDNTKETDRHQAFSHETEDIALSRRNILLGSIVPTSRNTDLRRAGAGAKGRTGCDCACGFVRLQAEHPRHPG